MLKAATDAKARLAEGRPRFDASPQQQREIVLHFFEAIRDGNLAGLQQYLSADVVLRADSGGKVYAAPRPVVGADIVGRMMLRLVAYTRFSYSARFMSHTAACSPVAGNQTVDGPRYPWAKSSLCI